MSRVVRDIPTSIVVCDLCDQPFGSDEEDRANLLVAVTPMGPATESTGRAGFWWPTRRTNPKPGTEHKRRQRDFHGHCIARLVESNINIYRPTDSEES